MKLSKRLQLFADMIKQYQQGDILADIGSDHAYLPVYLIEQKIITTAYACDIGEGPCLSARETIKQHQLEDKVHVLLGNGLDPILDKPIDMISIAGMGSYLMVEILDQHRNYLKNMKRLFLQANANVDYLRDYLYKNQFKIIDEEIVKDGKHIYEMMCVMYSDETISYDKKDIMFGPVLLKKQSPLWKEKWQRQYQIYQNIKQTLSPNHPRYQELEEAMKLVKEAISR